MQPTATTVPVLTGSLAGQEYVFHEEAQYVLGRAEECYPRLPDDYYHKDVSRRHCRLGVNPPEAWVQDLGSKNGTHVNGKTIGQRRSVDEESGQMDSLPRVVLKDGDEIALGGNVVLRVG